MEEVGAEVLVAAGLLHGAGGLSSTITLDAAIERLRGLLSPSALWIPAGSGGQILEHPANEAEAPPWWTEPDVEIDPEGTLSQTLLQAWRAAVEGYQAPWFEPVPSLRLTVGTIKEADRLIDLQTVGRFRLVPMIARLAGQFEWRWPLRIGIDGPRADEWVNRLGSGTYVGELYDVRTVGGGDEPSEILIVDADSPPTGSGVWVAAPHRATCVVLVATGSSAAELLDRAGSELDPCIAVGWPTDDIGRLKQVIYEMTHDHPLDVAFAIQAPEARVAGPPGLIDLSAVGRWAFAFAELGPVDGLLGDELRDLVRTTQFDEEAHGASEAVYRIREAEGRGLDATLRIAVGGGPKAEPPEEASGGGGRGGPPEEDMAEPPVEAEVEPPSPHPRRVQVEVRPGKGTRSEPEVRTALEPDRTYTVSVFIGFAGSRQVEADSSIDVSDVLKDAQSHTVQVTFQEIGALGRPQHGSIDLKPDRETQPALFIITTAPPVYRARIIVSFRNRVLQTVLFEADVRPKMGLARLFSLWSKREPIRLLVESNPRPSMSGLDARQEFDFALVFNEDPDGRGRVAAIGGEAPEVFATDQIDDTMRQIERTLSRVAEVGRHFGELRSDDSVALLRDLATLGRRLYNVMVDWQISESVRNPPSGRLQVIPGRPDGLFPVEFVYDKPMPDVGATLCEHAAEALLAGACPAVCPLPGQEHSVVCPLGFWSLSRVIERHAFLRKRGLDPDVQGLVAEPLEGRTELRVFGGGEYAASQRVDNLVPRSIAKVSEALKEALGHQIAPVDAWSDWSKDIAAGSPSLLVLLTHTDSATTSTGPVMHLEIGSEGGGEWLDTDHIERAVVVGPAGTPPPLVLLIGCSTGVTKFELQDFVASFMRNGASIVVATTSTVAGEYAADVTAALLSEMSAAATHTDAIGDALLAMKRRMLAAGNLTALALFAYGDADWRLVPA
jgi:hypothetical protein